MENNKEVINRADQAEQPLRAPAEALHQGLDEAMFKLLNFQAQHGADQNSTMIMLSLMNLLGIVNCMNKILPEGQKVRGAADLTSQIAGMLGGTMPAAGNMQGSPSNQGGLDPALLAALAGMLGGPRGSEGTGENRPGIDPALLGALASMLGGPGPGGGANPAALMAMLANMMGPKRPPESHKSKESANKEDRSEKPDEKGRATSESQKKEPLLNSRGMLKWDPRFGSPTSSF